LSNAGTASRPIGVFDSGVGGLTVLKALIARLPQEEFVYLGDTARLPYGTKSPQTVARYSLQAAEALGEYGLKCLVVACNTASSVGLPTIRAHIENVPVIGVIEPGARAACAASKSGHIAVIATEGTVRGGAYQRAILGIRADARVETAPAPLLVALAEEGLHSGAIANNVASHYLGPLFSPDRPDGCVPDTLVLGCTHFPMLIAAIRHAVGPHIQIVDSAATTAASVEAQLRQTGIAQVGVAPAGIAQADIAPAGIAPADRRTGRVRLLATDGRERFATVGSRFLERAITADEVELIDL